MQKSVWSATQTHAENYSGGVMKYMPVLILIMFGVGSALGFYAGSLKGKEIMQDHKSSHYCIRKGTTK